eukprot:6139420-Pyramimonas_sp.AAC.1
MPRLTSSFTKSPHTRWSRSAGSRQGRRRPSSDRGAAAAAGGLCTLAVKSFNHEGCAAGSA